MIDTTAAPAAAEEVNASTTLNLDRALIRGVAWTGGVKWAGQILAWGATIFVMRLLSPMDYGIMGMATLYLGLIQLLSEFGVGAAVVTLRQLTRDQVAQLNGLAVLFGLAGFALSAALAIPIGAFFNSPQLPAVIVVIGFGFVITSFCVIPASLMAREMDFRALSLYGGVHSVVTSLSTITMAVLGFGYWALALGTLAGHVAYSVLALSRRGHPFLFPRLESIRPAMTFSSHIIVSRMSWYAYSNADTLVIGRVLGQSALGLYSVAWSLATMVVDKISAVVGQVTPAVFAAAQTDFASVRRYLLNVTETLALVTFPAALGLALVAEDFTIVVLGEKWIAAALPLRLLACYGIVRSVTPLLPQVLNAVGDSFYPMMIGIVSALVLPVAFVLATRWGIEGVAITWIACYPLILIPLYLRVFRRIDLRPREYWASLWPAVSSSLVMWATVAAIELVVPAELPMALALGCQVAAGAVAYTGAVLLLHGGRVRAGVRQLRAGLAR